MTEHTNREHPNPHRDDILRCFDGHGYVPEEVCSRLEALVTKKQEEAANEREQTILGDILSKYKLAQLSTQKKGDSDGRIQ